MMLKKRPIPKAKDPERKKTNCQAGVGHIRKFLLKSLVQGFLITCAATPGTL